MRAAPLAAALVAFFYAGGVAAPAAAPSTRVAGKYYTIETTVLHYNVGSGAFATDAPIRITRPGLDAAAEKADGNTKTGQAVMQGNVTVHDAGGKASPQGKNAEPATLTCDRLDVDAKADTYHATGHAHYTSATRTATAAVMNLDRKHKQLHLEGDVTLTEGESTARASVVDVNLASGETISTGSPVILSKPASPAPSPLRSAGPGPTAAPQPSPNPRPAPSPSPQ